MKFVFPQLPLVTASPQEEAAHGAPIGVLRDLGSSPCSVTDAQCDLGQVTFRPQGPHVKNKDVNLQSLRILRFSESVSDLSTSILNYSYVKYYYRLLS